MRQAAQGRAHAACLRVDRRRARGRQVRADVRAAASAGLAARAQLVDELPASCLGALLALLFAQARARVGRPRAALRTAGC